MDGWELSIVLLSKRFLANFVFRIVNDLEMLTTDFTFPNRRVQFHFLQMFDLLFCNPCSTLAANITLVVTKCAIGLSKVNKLQDSSHCEEQN